MKELRADVTSSGLQASDLIQVPDGRVFTQSEYQRELAKHNRMVAAAANKQAAEQKKAEKKALSQAIKAQKAAMAAHKKEAKKAQAMSVDGLHLSDFKGRRKERSRSPRGRRGNRASPY